MNDAIKQYVDLYESHREAFDNGTPAALTRLRDAALATLATAVEPELERMVAPDYGMNVNRLAIDARVADSFHCDVPNLSTALYYVAGDVLHAACLHDMPGVEVMSLREAATRLPDVLERHLGSLADISRADVALNTLLAQDGVLVYVHEEVTATRPVQLVNVFNATAPMMAARRVLVVAERDAHLQLLTCDHSQRADTLYLNLQVTEVVAAEGATVEVYDLEEASERTTRVNVTAASQAAGSNVLVDTITLSGGTTVNNLQVDINGENATTQLLGMAIADGSQHVSNTTLLAHHAPRCNSREMYKYVLDDNAHGSFDGLIRVDSDCPRVEAYQGNRNVLASKTARMHSEPQLEIYTDDVKCSHGTTIGQLDEQALFYMRTRGLSLETSRAMLMRAFMADVVDAVRLDVLRDRLSHLVDKRLSGELASCATCGQCATRK